jgi:hypothetical protein
MNNSDPGTAAFARDPNSDEPAPASEGGASLHAALLRQITGPADACRTEAYMGLPCVSSDKMIDFRRWPALIALLDNEKIQASPCRPWTAPFV